MPKCDFSGYATKVNLRCSDGRVIKANAFKMNDGQTVPLVWQHQRNDPENILGHAVLENRDDGVYAYCTFNDTSRAQHTKKLVEHGDITQLSIYANQLQQSGADVMHGNIREVSLVVAGANPGACIDNLQIAHSDGGYDYLEDEAVIYTGLNFDLEHADAKTDKESGDTKVADEAKETKEAPAPAEDKKKERSAKEILDSMTEEQKNLLYALVGAALADDGSMLEDDEDQDADNDDAEHSEGGYDEMKKNVFDDTNEGPATYTLTHSDEEDILASARKMGSFQSALKQFADDTSASLEHGVTDLEILFPEAKAATAQPELLTRPMEWVSKVWNGFKKSPMSRIKSVYADLTMDEARAKGYIKGHRKVEEEFGLLKRVTQPTTIYKKQKFDRDDLIDITDFNFVAFIQSEMRTMLNEELSRAALVGDGRTIGDEDKIDENCIRPIYKEDELYAIRYDVPIADDADTTTRADAIVEGAIRSRKEYRGSGNPTFFTTTETLNDLMLAKDKNGRRIYNTTAELAAGMRVADIVEVPVMENMVRTDEAGKSHELLGIIVNLTDYTIGADRGGAVTMFDDFDIDYNKQIYLIETRLSGSLNKPYSAIILERTMTTNPVVTTVKADDPNTTRYNHKVSEFQSDIQMGSDFIAGKLRYAEVGEDIFNGNHPTGHYLSLALAATEGGKVYAKMTGPSPHAAEIEVTDGYCVFFIPTTDEKIVVTTKKDDKIVSKKTYSLTNLQLL